MNDGNKLTLNYNNHIDFCQKIERVEKSINFLTINCFPVIYKEELYSFLSDKGFSSYKGEKKLPQSHRHSFFKKFEDSAHNGDDIKKQKVELYLSPKKYKFTGITIKLFYPSKTLVLDLITFFNGLEYFPYDKYRSYPKLSFLERTIDLYTDDQEYIARTIKQHLYMSHNRSEPFIFRGEEMTNKEGSETFYIVHKKKNDSENQGTKSKFMRSYTKEKLPGSPVRLEHCFGRKALKARGIDLHNLVDYLETCDLSKEFHFREFRRDAFLKRKVNYRPPNLSIVGDWRTSRLNPNRNTLRNKICLGLRKRRPVILSYFDCFFPQDNPGAWPPVSQICYDFKSDEKEIAKFNTERFNKRCRELETDPLPPGEILKERKIDYYFPKMEEFNNRFFALVGTGGFLQ